jgi:hypothetical protein
LCRKHLLGDEFDTRTPKAGEPVSFVRPGDTAHSSDSVLTLGEPDSDSGTICFIQNLLDDLRGLGKREQLVGALWRITFWVRLMMR